MKLNQDCIRDLMLYLEDNLGYKDEIIINHLELEPYSKDELLYTTERLIEAKYINSHFGWNMQSSKIITVNSLSYNGHQFLDTIRDDKIWTKTKSILSIFKSVSLEILSDTASKVIIALVNQQLNMS